MPADPYFVVPGLVVLDTAKAILLEVWPTCRELWIPRSVCQDGDKIETGDRDPAVAEWFFRMEF